MRPGALEYAPIVRHFPPFLLLVLFVACGKPQEGGGGDWGDRQRDRKDFAVPVRTAPPERGTVEDYVETQATLESELRADIHAEVDGELIERLKDVGDPVGIDGEGGDAFLLARIDDRDLALALKEAEIRLRQAKGQLKELELAQDGAERALEQAKVNRAEAESVFKRTEAGISDGTLSLEEHETATFARNLAQSKVLSAESALSKSKVAVELGSVAILEAEVERDRAAVAASRGLIRAPLKGVVTYCDVRPGERVRTGDLLYRVEDPTSLIVYGDIPVRQAVRVEIGDPVRIESTATPGPTMGEVIMIAPTVNEESGTVAVKVRVEPAAGFKPGLFVTLRIVAEKRENALVVPKRAVLHHDEDGAYLFVIQDDLAERRLVTTGFKREGVIEITEGLAEGEEVVVEGQDTLADGAKVKREGEEPPRTEESTSGPRGLPPSEPGPALRPGVGT